MEPLFGGAQGAERRRAARQRVGGQRSTDLDLTQIYRVRMPTSANLAEVATALQRDPAVEWVEPNYIYSIKSAAEGSEPDTHLAPADVPNDPFFGSSGSWGQSFPDLWGLFQIEAPAAWELSQGAGVVVAVIDTGLDIEHPDIAENVWVNEGEIPGNGIDDDGNGFVDDVNGWDFTRCREITPRGDCPEVKEPGPDVPDVVGHGTHVAGTIAAIGGNGIGIIGVAPKATVMAVKGLDEFGQGTSADLAEALAYAAENGARVINASWSGPPSHTISMAIDYVTEAFDVVVVASVGNDAAPLERGYYPANLPNIVAVGATTYANDIAAFSNYGGPLDLVAPGGGDTGNSSVQSPARSILSLLADAARGRDGWAADCRTKCVACEDGSPPVDESEPCLQNYCVERVEVCGETGCLIQCTCRDGTVLAPGNTTCPYYDNTCSEYQDVCPPGPWVVTEDYVRAAGTSFAAPHVSGVATLVRSAHAAFTQLQVRQVLRNTADDLGPAGWDERFGYGRVNAAAAVALDESPVAEISVPENRQKVWEGNFPFDVEGTTLGGGRPLRTWALRVHEDGSADGVAIVATGTTDVTDGRLGTLALDHPLALVPGRRYLLELVVEDVDGRQASDSKVFLLPGPRYAVVPVPDPFDEGGGSFSLSRNGQRLALSRGDRETRDSGVWLWDASTRLMTRFYRASPGRLSPDGHFLLFGRSIGRPFGLYDIGSGAVRDIPLHGLVARSPSLLTLSEGARTAAFVSQENLDPQIGNADGSAEAFLFDLPDGPARQITDGPRFGQVFEVDELVMTPDALHLAFVSRADLDSTATTGTHEQVFLFNDSTKVLRQLTNRTDPSRSAGRPSLSADGSRVAYEQIGPSGFEGIFFEDLIAGTREHILDVEQGAPNIPLLSGNGRLLAFRSAADLDVGVGNEDLNFEVYVLDLATRQIAQVTDTLGLSEVAAAIDSNGGVLVIDGSSELNGVGLSPNLLRAVPRKRPNQRPLLSIPDTLSAEEGKTLRTVLHASDPDGDPITFHVEVVPPFESATSFKRMRDLASSELVDHGDGTAELVFTPRHNEAGRYTLRVAAFDEAGEVDIKNVELVMADTQPEGDANCDGQVDREDVLALIHALFDPERRAGCVTADTDDDGGVSVNDLVALLLKPAE